jgi:hypothetical protein
MRRRLLVALGKIRFTDERLLWKAFQQAGCHEPSLWAETWGRSTDRDGEEIFVAENTGSCPPTALSSQSVLDVSKFCDFLEKPHAWLIKPASGIWVDGKPRKASIVPGTIWSYEAKGMHVVIGERDSLALLTNPDVTATAEIHEPGGSS